MKRSTSFLWDLFIIAVLIGCLMVIVSCVSQKVTVVTGESSEEFCYEDKSGESLVLMQEIDCEGQPIEGLLTEPEEEL